MISRRQFLGGAAGSFAVLASAGAAAEESAGMSVDRITIEAAGRRHGLTVEIADTEARRGRGLMFRHRLPEDHGMLFRYDEPRQVAMWMKNTLIPLDIVFIRSDGTVSEVASGTVPLSLDVIRSREEVLAALELAAGVAQKLGVAPGAVIRHPMFGNAD